MFTREHVARHAPVQELSLITPPNWTGIVFLSVLSLLHFSIAVPAFFEHHWEGYLSLIFALAFAAAAAGVFFLRYELTIETGQKRIRLRTGFRRLGYERFIPFADVHAVRLTHGRGQRPTIEILCDNEDLECPPTPIARQEALYLAVVMHVELIKVSNDPSRPCSDRVI